MLFAHILSAFTYEVDQQFIPSIFISKGSSMAPRDYESKDSSELRIFNKRAKEVDHSGSKEAEYSMFPKSSPFIRTVVISRGNPIQRQFKHHRGTESKGMAFENDNEPFNHDYPTHHAYLPFYYEHSPQTLGGFSTKSLEDAVKGNVGTFPDKFGGVFVFKTLMFLIFIVISGLIGFYFGKLQESKNYVRVGIPHTN